MSPPWARLLRRMDTLFVRLFLLLWGALVTSHLLGYWSLHLSQASARPLAAWPAPVPSLPPLPFLTASLALRPPHAPSTGPGEEANLLPGLLAPDMLFAEPHLDTLPGNGGPPPGFPGLPGPRGLWLDYLVRVLVTGLAAWLGARWLTEPMRRLAQTAQALGVAPLQAEAAAQAQADEWRGPREVRQTATVFNAMVARLRERLDQRGLFLAAVSHDLRTPLTRVRLRLQRLAEADGGVDALSIARSVADLRDMDTLLDSVLDVLREERQPEPAVCLDAQAFVQSLVDDLVAQGAPVALSVTAGGADAPCAEMEGAPPSLVHAQPTALRRVIDNLLGNALRHGGRARVDVSEEADWVCIRIDDDGPGIPPDLLEAVFRPFYRVEPSRSRATAGTGLGLFIARDLAERQGGRLTLSNRPAGGLRAALLLPLERG